jgi:hypothetical protein
MATAAYIQSEMYWVHMSTVEKWAPLRLDAGASEILLQVIKALFPNKGY